MLPIRKETPHIGNHPIPVPILKGNAQLLNDLRTKVFTTDYEDLTVVDFTEQAQCCNIYEEFIERWPPRPKRIFGISALPYVAAKED